MSELLAALTKIRQTKDVLPIPPGVELYWSKDPEVALRPYQIQMVWNLILCPSFLCGDSVGLGKCLESSTYVLANGLQQIGSLWPKEAPLVADTWHPLEPSIQVPTDKGPSYATHIYYGGEVDTLKVKLYNGVVLEGTPEHPVRILSPDGGYRWSPLRDLTEASVVCLKKGPSKTQYTNELTIQVIEPFSNSGTPKTISIPSRMTPDLALWLGLLVGDGCYTNSRKNTVSFTVHDSECDIIKSVTKLTETLFGLSPSIVKDRRNRVLNLNINSVKLREVIRGLDLICIDQDSNKYVPASILRAEQECWKAFLSGILATDGHITKAGRLEITMKSERLLREMQQMFMALGVHSRLCNKVVKPTPGNNGGTYWRLDCNGSGLNLLPDIFKYCPSQRKLDRLKTTWGVDAGRNISRFGDYTNLRSRWVTLYRKCMAGYGMWNPKNRELRPESFFTWKEKVLKYHTLYAGREKANRHPVRFFTPEDWAELDELSFIYGEILPMKVVSIETSKVGVFDLVVPEGHTFIANGIISHNTVMGSGAMAAIKAAQPNVKFLVYTTTSAQRQWTEEVQKFTSLKARMLADTGKKMKPKVARLTDFYNFIHGLGNNDDVLVMRYATVIHDGLEQIDYIRHKTNPICVIYDEATSFKSSDTMTHKHVRAISALCQWRYGLSATPIENTLTEIFHIFGGLGLDVLGNEEYFKQQYCETEIQGYRIQWYGKVRKKIPIVITTGYKNLNDLSERLIPYFWARSQAEVGEQLPQLNTETIDIVMSKEQIQKTEDIWNGLYSIDHLDLDEEDFKKVDSKMTVLLLHQLVSINPALLSNRAEDYINAPISPKEAALIELLNTTLYGSKTIVYTRFRRELERLKILLRRETGRNVLFVHGGMNKDDRYEMIKKFQGDPHENLICINQAAFQAVNLQQAANLICLDLPWSWGGVLQLVGRMVRLKSPHAICNLYILHTEGSIDSHVIGHLKNKKGIFERILSKSASLGVFDETDHIPTPEGDRGFVSKMFDTMTLARHNYKPSALSGSRGKPFLSFE